MTDDTLYPFSFEDLPVRGFWVRLDQTWHQSTRRHDYPPLVASHLGQLQLATAILANSIKRDGLLTLQATGDGPVSALMAECRNQQGLRCIARLRDHQALGKGGTDLPGILGAGNLAITIRPEGREAYQGVVPLDGGSVAACLESYFMQSEQLPTRLWLAAADGQAAGLMVQRLPGRQSGSDDDDSWRRIGLLGDTLQQDELLSLPAKDVLHRLFHEDTLRLHPGRPMAFQCSCSRERTVDALRMMGEKDVLGIIREDGHVSVDCQFCGEHYSYGAEDIATLFRTH